MIFASSRRGHPALCHGSVHLIAWIEFIDHDDPILALNASIVAFLQESYLLLLLLLLLILILLPGFNVTAYLGIGLDHALLFFFTLLRLCSLDNYLGGIFPLTVFVALL